MRLSPENEHHALRSIVHNSRDGIAVFESDGSISFANAALGVLLGYSTEELTTLNINAILQAPALECIAEQPTSQDSSQDPPEGILIDRDGTLIHARLSVAVVAHPPPGRRYLYVPDTARYREEGVQVQRLRSLFQNLVNNNQSGIIMLDSAGNVLFANPAAEVLLARTGKPLVGANFGLPVQFSERSEMEIVHPGEGTTWVEFTATKSEWDETSAYLVMLHDITYLKDAEAKVRKAVYRDGLTDLPNRTLYMEHLEQAIKELQRSKTGHLAVLYMDLDRFKEVNDNLGHAAGDEMLQEVGERLRGVFRDSDLVARFGGDEFAALIRFDADRAEIDPVVQRVLDSFTEPFSVAGKSIYSRVSLGISLFPGDAQTADTLLMLADTAMYAAKAEVGKSTCRYYNASVGELNKVRFQLSNETTQAINSGQFRIYYQPQIELSSGRVSGLEALVRWQHPELGMLPPDSFIPLLEETGMIRELGLWVLRGTLAQIRSWTEQGLTPPPIAVNVSAVQVDQGDLFPLVKQALLDHSLPPDALVIELTESVVVRNIQHANTLLRQLEFLGVNVHLDDFGTGTSSLGILKQLPINLIKIDKVFIQSMLSSVQDESLIRAILEMSRGLGKPVLAEGIELPEQRERLIELGCEFGQGYLFSRPIPADQLMSERYLLPDSRFTG